MKKDRIKLGRAISTLTMMAIRNGENESKLALALARAEASLRGDIELSPEELLKEYYGDPEIYLIMRNIIELTECE